MCLSGFCWSIWAADLDRVTEPDHAQLVRDGIARARRNGIVWGRPRTSRETEIRSLLESGWKQYLVCRHLHVGYWTVRRVADQIKEENAREA